MSADKSEGTQAASDQSETSDAAVVRSAGSRRGPGPMGGMGMPAEKPMNFGGTLRRLVGDMREHRLALIVSVLLGIGSVVFAVLGPKLLGNATNLVFGAVLSRNLPAGLTREEAIAGVRAQGDDRLADMLSQMQFTPGEGLNSHALMVTLAWVLAASIASALRRCALACCVASTESSLAAFNGPRDTR